MRTISERLRALVILDEVGSDNPLGREAADRIETLEAALRPFAKCSEIYPNALPEADAGFAGLYDPLCPVTIGDFHRARAALQAALPTIKEPTDGK